MKNSIATGMISLIIAGAAACAGQARELKYSTHLPPVIGINANGIVPFFDQIKKETNGEITVKYFWAGQLYDVAGNYEAVKDGVVDMAFTQPVSNQALLPINATFSDMFFYGVDPYVTAPAINETILLDCPECKAEYVNNDTAMLMTHAAGTARLMCAKDIESVDQIKGLKIMGLPSETQFVQSLGAVLVDVPPPQMVETLARNQADCALVAEDWLKIFHLDEAIKTVIDVPVGSQFVPSMITTNLDTWNSFSPEVKRAFLKNIPTLMYNAISSEQGLADIAKKGAQEKGVKFVDLNGQFKASLDQYMSHYKEAIDKIAERRGVKISGKLVDAFLKNVAKWKKLIDENGKEKLPELAWQEIYSKVSY